MFDAKAMADQVVKTVREFVAKATEPLIAEIGQLKEQIRALPAPVNGRDGVDGKEGAPGRDGKDVDQSTVETIAKSLREEICATDKSVETLRADVDAIKALPRPQDGKDGINGIDGKDGANGLDGKDGVGRDGRDGLPGVPGLPGEKGVDGLHGKDGADGLGLEDFDVALGDDGRTLSFKFIRGEVCIERQIKLAVILDAGVYRVNSTYDKGDVTTWDGCSWIAQKDIEASGERPGQPEWRMNVRKGSNGKDGVITTPPPLQSVRLR